MVSETQKLELIQLIMKLQDEELLVKIKSLLNNQYSSNPPAQTVEYLNVSRAKRKFGFAKGQITYVAPDFDETPSGFEDYLP